MRRRGHGRETENGRIKQRCQLEGMESYNQTDETRGRDG